VVSVLLALTGVAVLLHRIGMWATFRFTARSRPHTTRAVLPPLTLLKPIKGVEDGLEDNLRSFYAQEYPAALQIVFTSTDAADPGMAVARRVAADHPQLRTEFVLARDDFGSNPKVSNMQGGLQRARHDLVLQSDANVRLGPGYLQRIVSEMLEQDAALLGSLVVGVGERSVAATLENLQLTAFTAPGLCMAKELAGINCVLGKSMLLRRSQLESIGGLARVKDMLAEDYMLAQFYERAGLRVALSTETVANVNTRTSLRQFLARHSRWLKMRAVVSAPGYAADLCSNPLPLALAAVAAGGFDPRLLALAFAVYAYKCACDARLLHRLRGHGLGLAQLWATPARDLALATIWMYALFSRTTEWRGRRLRLGRDSLLLADEGSLLLRALRRLGLLRGGSPAAATGWSGQSAPDARPRDA
jgi:ceramide glucosyltransferase